MGLLLPGAWAGLPEGNWPGGKLAFEGGDPLLELDDLEARLLVLFHEQLSLVGRTGG